MAGNYPDPPGYRVPYHLNGTLGLVFDSSGAAIEREMTANEISNMNDDNVDTTTEFGGSGNRRVGLLFPRLLDIDGIYVAGKNHADWEWSANTTNLVDGTWQLLSQPPSNVGYGPSARTQIVGQGAVAAKGIRWVSQGSGAAEPTIYDLHIYGEPSAAEGNTHRLEVWHPSTDNKINPAYFDLGDVPQGSSRDKDFRIKNLSPDRTATDITVSLDVPNDPTPSFDAAHLFQVGGGSFLAQVQIGSLSPGSISPVVTLRQTMQSDAALSLRYGIVRATSVSMA